MVCGLGKPERITDKINTLPSLISLFNYLGIFSKYVYYMSRTIKNGKQFLFPNIYQVRMQSAKWRQKEKHMYSGSVSESLSIYSCTKGKYIAWFRKTKDSLLGCLFSVN